MKKLNKEYIYINLQGKSKEELSEIQNVLIMFNEATYRKDFKSLYNDEGNIYLFFDGDEWITDNETYNKQEVTIQQLKEILQPMENKEFEKLLNYAKSVDFKISDLVTYINKVISLDYYGQLEGDEPEDKAYLFILKHKDIDLSLEQQLEKAKAEVKRIEEEIEEQNKPKNGDWVVNNYGVIWRCSEVDSKHLLTKITDQELINKLNNLIK